jgi:proton-dependent oligopeptide transporter, POT family
LLGRGSAATERITVSSLKARFAKIPEGAGVLFFIQVFATLGFAVLYSTLVLYATKHLHFTTPDATTMMGVFGAFNYGLHLFGGYLGGRFLSNRNLFVGGMVLQVLGCACIAGGTMALLYLGLALFLTGSGLNVTCLNMMLTQRFKPDDVRREAAFLWNYAGMNVGFFIGFTAAGHYQRTENYSSLFIFATIGNVLAILIAVLFWKTLADRDTRLLEVDAGTFRRRFAIGIAILFGLVPVLWFLLQHPHGTGTLVKGISAAVALALVWLTFKHRVPREKNNMWAYLILTMGSLVFWALYQMAPSGLQLFAVNNVNRDVWGVEVAPQWIQNINTVVIVVGGPLMSALFVRLRARGWKIDVPKQFAASLILMGLGFLALPAGIAFADVKGMSAFSWLFVSYIFQSIGELLISPVGYAMIGKLAPRQHQGVMMGAWMLVTGLASVFAGDFSSMVPEPSEGSAVTTNPVYSKLFIELGCGSLVVGVVLVLLTPFLRKLITDGEEAAPEEPVEATAAAA